MDLFSFDNIYRQNGYKTIAGIDEAGRGPWAGPVVAAAVILPQNVNICGLNDSKKLSPLKREIIFKKIQKIALSIGIEIVDHTIIDTINILNATYMAMHGAIKKLLIPADIILVDGNLRLVSPVKHIALIGGDGLSASIAAASIVAKVTRDRLMVKLSKKYPEYNFQKHKGYGTKEHQQALFKYGPCSIHRKSFSPVKNLIQSTLNLK